MVKVLDGKIVRDDILHRLSNEVLKLSKKPKLAIIQVGDLKGSGAYIRQKKLFGEKIGAIVSHIRFPNTAREVDLVKEIQKLNHDKNTHGIIVQIPLPKNLNKDTLVDAISPEKDVDGLAAANIKMLLENNSHGFIPATAKGVLSLLDYYHIPIAGKKVAIVGRSTLVGKPLVAALLNRDATVTVCHSKTKNLEEETRRADILIVAAGQPKLIGPDHVSGGQTIIDVGINLISGKHLQEEVEKRTFVGDVDFESVKNSVSAISPVPGGVGPMTVASLFENLLKAYTLSGD